MSPVKQTLYDLDNTEFDNSMQRLSVSGSTSESSDSGTIDDHHTFPKGTPRIDKPDLPGTGSVKNNVSTFIILMEKSPQESKVPSYCWYFKLILKGSVSLSKCHLRLLFDGFYPLIDSWSTTDAIKTLGYGAMNYLYHGTIKDEVNIDIIKTVEYLLLKGKAHLMYISLKKKFAPITSASTQSSLPENSKTDRPKLCSFCHKTSHTRRKCRELKKLIEDGKLCIANGYVKRTDGVNLPSNSNGVKAAYLESIAITPLRLPSSSSPTTTSSTNVKDINRGASSLFLVEEIFNAKIDRLDFLKFKSTRVDNELLKVRDKLPQQLLDVELRDILGTKTAYGLEKEGVPRRLGPLRNTMPDVVSSTASGIKQERTSSAERVYVPVLTNPFVLHEITVTGLESESESESESPPTSPTNYAYMVPARMVRKYPGILPRFKQGKDILIDDKFELILNRILESNINITLRNTLALSPELCKAFLELIRLKRVPTNTSGPQPPSIYNCPYIAGRPDPEYVDYMENFVRFARSQEAKSKSNEIVVDGVKVLGGTDDKGKLAHLFGKTHSIPATLNGKSLKTLLSSGFATSVIHKDICVANGIPISPRTKVSSAANSANMSVVGTAVVDLDVQGSRVVMCMLVVDYCRHDIVFGVDFQASYKLSYEYKDNGKVVKFTMHSRDGNMPRTATWEVDSSK